MQMRHNVHLVQACFALLAYPLAAQIDRATLNGTVTDSSGAVFRA